MTANMSENVALNYHVVVTMRLALLVVDAIWTICIQPNLKGTQLKSIKSYTIFTVACDFTAVT